MIFRSAIIISITRAYTHAHTHTNTYAHTNTHPPSPSPTYTHTHIALSDHDAHIQLLKLLRTYHTSLLYPSRYVSRAEQLQRRLQYTKKQLFRVLYG